MPPFLFDQACERGEISYGDVVLLVRLELTVGRNPSGLMEFLEPGWKADQEQKAIDEKNTIAFNKLLKESEW